MNKYLKNILIFFRLMDEHDGNLSLSSIAMIVVIVKLAMVQQASVMDLGGFFVAIMNMNLKKWINNTKLAQQTLEQVNDVSNKIKQVAETIGVNITNKE